MTGKRMDPERLAALYDLVPTTPPGFGMLHLSHVDLRELLADRDHWEAEAKRLESLLEKCDVSPEAVTMVLRPVIAAMSASDWETVANETQDAMVAHLAERTRERDDARAEAMRWRSQCPVTAEHVEADLPAPIEQALAWVDAQGWSRDEHSERHGDEYVYGPKGSIDIKLSLAEQNGAAWVVEVFIRHAADDTGRPAHDILDEMATATPGGDQ